MINFIALVLFLAFWASGATRLVEPGNGSAYQTIASAVNNLSPGDSVIIKAGTYRESVVVDSHLHSPIRIFPDRMIDPSMPEFHLVCFSA